MSCFPIRSFHYTILNIMSNYEGKLELNSPHSIILVPDSDFFRLQVTLKGTEIKKS